MTLTPEQEAALQDAFVEAMEKVGQLSGVLGFACVVVTKGNGPNTLYAGDTAIVSAGLDLLMARFDEDGIEQEIADMIDTDEAADTLEAFEKPTRPH